LIDYQPFVYLNHWIAAVERRDVCMCVCLYLLTLQTYGVFVISVVAESLGPVCISDPNLMCTTLLD